MAPMRPKNAQQDDAQPRGPALLAPAGLADPPGLEIAHDGTLTRLRMSQTRRPWV